MSSPPKFLHIPNQNCGCLFVRNSQADSRMYMEIKRVYISPNKSEIEQI